MSAEENKALAQRSWELASQGNPDLLEEVYAADLVWHEPDQEVQGLEEAKQFYSKYLSAFPDISFTGEDAIAKGEGRYTLDGTWHPPGRNRGPWPSHWQTI